MPTFFCHTNFVLKNAMDFDTIDTDIWFEIQDCPGEIFDIPEMSDSKDFDLNGYLNADYDY
jgi:hypothetical protein